MGKEIGGETLTEPSVVKVWKPASIEEAAMIKRRRKQSAAYIAGGTLLQLQKEQGTPLPSHLIRLDQLTTFSNIEDKEDSVEIGAFVTLAECVQHRWFEGQARLLQEAANGVASPAVRNRGTIGGNIAYGIGDTIPALLALDCDITWMDEEQKLTTSLWYFLQYARKEMALILSIQIPKQLSSAKRHAFYQKVGRRESFIPSLVTAAIVCERNYRGEIDHIRMAVAGGSSQPVRLENCEAYLIGQTVTTQCLDELHERIMDEFLPASDPFVSKQYKQIVAANLMTAELAKFIEK
ncbi:FAD binding domain-containing protein [Gracilibacillus caseinilyticus]|uniref:FAD binding domain-containing protein n=1 Tax=Gracilibacillus caseinilyticus TaxID=2932256 RepID=A0ABY4EZU3_9BACI|nr:FAD binding domain-containing protein [Gracilibacillus caseinilyticus]UOQ49915.1 FAD binding domain-containing protein [Gracilibacillus caseinilyticus]